jgi:RHS repeat-associated protein
VIKETNATTGNITDYLYGDDLIKQTKAANDSYHLYDGLGSTRALSDSTGTITDTYNYESFGSLLNQTGSTPNDYLFTGEQYDSGLDNYYLRARYYDQGIGRFTQQDTWMGNNSDPVTLHKYLYAHTDPVNNIDPTGNFTLVSFSVANNVRSILSDITVDVGFSLLDGAFSDDASEASSNPLAVGALVIAGGGGIKLLKLLSSKCKKLKDKCSFSKSSGWGFWNDYPKIKFGSKEYAVINSRYYTRHAVDRMTPSGLGVAAGGSVGRSISPTFIENVIATGKKSIVFKNGEMRNIYKSGTVEVVTTAGNRIVITVVAK